MDDTSNRPECQIAGSGTQSGTKAAREQSSQKRLQLVTMLSDHLSDIAINIGCKSFELCEEIVEQKFRSSSLKRLAGLERPLA